MSRRYNMMLYDEPARSIGDLTERHQEIITLLAAGKSNREIADDLCVTTQTIKNHIVAIYWALRLPFSKDGGNNRVKAARWYWEQMHGRV